MESVPGGVKVAREERRGEERVTALHIQCLARCLLPSPCGLGRGSLGLGAMCVASVLLLSDSTGEPAVSLLFASSSSPLLWKEKCLPHGIFPK